jgi:hypothetical protein
MRPSGCLSLIAVALLSPIWVSGAQAESGETSREAAEAVLSSPAASMAVSSAPSRDSEALSNEAPSVERGSEPPRPRSSDALMRALMVISSAGGGRPFPLVPR